MAMWGRGHRAIHLAIPPRSQVPEALHTPVHQQWLRTVEAEHSRDYWKQRALSAENTVLSGRERIELANERDVWKAKAAGLEAEVERLRAMVSNAARALSTARQAVTDALREAR